jgi:sterile alpha motif and leucine zipper-containing kinase AZK
MECIEASMGTPVGLGQIYLHGLAHAPVRLSSPANVGFGMTRELSNRTPLSSKRSSTEVIRLRRQSTDGWSQKSHEPKCNDESSWSVDIKDVKLGPRIGIGAFGEVYRGIWRHTDVAVKLLLDQALPDKTIESLEKEISIMKKLRHPNILQFMGACTHPPHLCIVTEYMNKGSLFKLLHRTPEWQPTYCDKLQIAIDIARGMHYLHSSKPPIIHGDLKSANILLNSNGAVKVCDFGLARVKHSSKLSTDSKMGTPEWTAPEILQSNPINEASDVYSFGVVLWELITEEVPWNDRTPMQVILAVGYHKERLVIPSDASKTMQALLQKCFGEPNERPSFEHIIQILRIEKVSQS